MTHAHKTGEPAPTPTQQPQRTGEGAQTALQALIRNRRLQADPYEPGQGELPPPPNK